MTCIVGLVDEGAVWLGADACGMDEEYDRAAMVAPKVFTLRGAGIAVVVGYTDDFRFGQLLEHRLSIPSRSSSDHSLERWLAVEFADAVRTCLEDGGYTWREDGHEEGGTLLLGMMGRLFMMQSNFGVTERRRGYDAIGCGSTYAKSALWAARRAGVEDPEDLLKLALLSAEKHSGGVMPPFTFVQLDRAWADRPPSVQPRPPRRSTADVLADNTDGIRATRVGGP